MGDLESSCSDSTVPPLARPPPPLPTINRPKSGRRVAFSEPPKHHRFSSNEHNPRNKNCHSCCFVCFAWVFLSIFAFLLLLLLLGVLFLSFIRADLPEVYVVNLSFSKFHVANMTTDSSESVIDMDVGLRFNVSNKNDKFDLSYGPIAVNVVSGGVKLGESSVSGFSQRPKNETALEVNTVGRKIEVEKEVAEKFQTNMMNSQMVLDVYLSGNVGIHLAGFKVVGMPFRAACEKIEEFKVINGDSSKCFARIFAPRS